MLLKEIAGAHSPHDHRLSEHRIYLITFLAAVLLNPGLTTLGHGEHEHGPSEGDLSSPR